jgi:hypothetical protein
MSATMHIVVFLVLACVLAATLRHGLPWHYFVGGSDDDQASLAAPKSAFVRILTAEWWVILAIFVVAAAAGSFARSEWSVLPWSGFVLRMHSYGVLEAIDTAIVVAIADVWLFCGVAVFLERQEYQRLKREGEGRDDNQQWLMQELAIWRAKRKYYLIINVLAGLLLTTPQNPVYRLLDRLPLPEQCSLPGLC